MAVHIVNFDEFCASKPRPSIIPQIKSPFRMVISSKSAGGKTNLLLNMVLNPLVYYDRLIVFSTTLGQEKYKFMQDFFEELYQDELKKRERSEGKHMTVGKMIRKPVVADAERYIDTHEQREPVERIATFYDDMDSFPAYSDLSDEHYTLIVVDDCILEKNQRKITEYFVKGRHKKISIIYQTQKFTALPPVMREQASHYIFMGKQNNFILNTMAMSVQIGLDYKSMRKLFLEYVTDTFDFIMFDVTNPDENRIIFKNLDQPIPLDAVRVV